MAKICPHCGAAFAQAKNCSVHIKQFHSSNPLSLQSGGEEPLPTVGFNRRRIALQGYAQSHRYILPFSEDVDLPTYTERCVLPLAVFLERKLAVLKGIKALLSICIRFVKATDPDVTIEVYFNTKPSIMLSPNDVEDEIRKQFSDMDRMVDNFVQEGSGWTLEEIIHIDIHIGKYKPLQAASYFPTPLHIWRRKAVINVQNFDQKCFLWSALASLYPVAKNAGRVTKYKKMEKRLCMKGIRYPVQEVDFEKFERQNNVSLNVFKYDAQTKGRNISLLYLSKYSSSTKRHVNMLLLIKGKRRHYCCIKNLARLLQAECSKHTATITFCNKCLKICYSLELLEKHSRYCRGRRAYSPEIKAATIETVRFKHWKKCLPNSYVIYADFECLLQKANTVQVTNTTTTQLHVPCSFGMFGVVRCCSKRSPYGLGLKLYRGLDCVETFLDEVLKIAQDYQQQRDSPAPIRLTAEDVDNFLDSSICYLCKKQTDDAVQKLRKVRDHCHTCGEYRGPAHTICNIQLAQSRNITIVFHNLRRYDGHLIIPTLGKIASQRGYQLECLAKAPESYVSFSIKLNHVTPYGKKLRYSIVFIDSFAFLSTSLANLVSLTNAKDFTHLRQHGGFTSDEDFATALRKNIYPYEYMDGFEKFDLPDLPQKSCFFSSLSLQEPSDEEYKLAQDVWHRFNMKTFADYHDFYLKLDTLQLADVFENFRNFCLTYYNLDPAHYVSLPSLSWDACLKMTQAIVQVPPTQEMYEFIERGIRGGHSVISHRYAKANNKYLKSFDPTKASNYIIYLDLNNLYGYCMMQPLPYSDLEWIGPQNIRLPPESGIGYILEVDLIYPAQLHDAHNDLPLAPEHKTVPMINLSDYCLMNKPTSYQVSRKLLTTLSDKTNYIIHWKTLMLYMKQGLCLSKVHRVLKFREVAWMKPYIDFNTTQRQRSESKFEKDMFKLLINSIFGKSIENVRAYVNFKLVMSPKKLAKLISSPRFEYLSIFNKDLVGVSMIRPSVQLNKPIAVGFTVLELAKLYVYEFHYDFLKKKYGNYAKLLFTDTDSLCYHITTGDVYEDFQKHEELFDFSNYPKNHFLYSTKNTQTPGKMKDECKSIPIKEFIGLRAKLYSIKLDDESEQKKAKGISKVVTKQQIRHDMYKDTITKGLEKSFEMHCIRSEKHVVKTVKLLKRGLCPYDDKRYIMSDGVSSFAYGHYKISSK